jgi:hypothetical protein
MDENHVQEMFRVTNHPERYLLARGNEVHYKKGEAGSFAFRFLLKKDQC